MRKYAILFVLPVLVSCSPNQEKAGTDKHQNDFEGTTAVFLGKFQLLQLPVTLKGGVNTEYPQGLAEF